MKKLTTLISLLPATAMAHGLHGPVDAALHSFAHVWSVAIVLSAVVALGYMWRRRP